MRCHSLIICNRKALLTSIKNLYSTEGQGQKLQSAFSKKKVLSLMEFIEDRQRNDPKYQFDHSPELMFRFGISPLRLKHELFVYFKYSYWHQDKIGQQKILTLFSTIDHQVQKQQNSPPDSPLYLQKQALLFQYKKQIATTLMPSDISTMQICESYLHYLSFFLKNSQEELTPIETSHIFRNIEKILFWDQSQGGFINQKQYGWLVIQTFDAFLDKLKYKFKALPGSQKTLLITIAKTLRSVHLPFLQFIKKELQMQKQYINLYEFLCGLNYLSINRTFPYQYFYRNKRNLISLVESSQNLSQKKVKNSIAMLQIFTRQRLVYCEQIVDRLLTCIQQNLAASDQKQLVRIIYYYSRLKYSIDYDFVIKLVERVYMFMDTLTEQDYSLIIKAVANLNYQNELLVQKLKKYNYQLFLTNLKYGCQNVGSYYKAILDEVEKSYKNDTLRYSRQEDEPIIQMQTEEKEDEKVKGDELQMV